MASYDQAAHEVTWEVNPAPHKRRCSGAFDAVRSSSIEGATIEQAVTTKEGARTWSTSSRTSQRLRTSSPMS